MQAAVVEAVLLGALAEPAVAVMAHRVTLPEIPEQLIEAVVAVVLMTKALQVKPVAMVALAL
jgi:hypothetical protein